MKTTINNYPLNKNGKPILSPLSNEIQTDEYRGQSYKENGSYLLYVGKRGTKHIYSY